MSHADRMIAAALERGDKATAERWQRIKARVDQAPPLAPAVRDRLAVLLRPEPAPLPRRAAQRAA